MENGDISNYTMPTLGFSYRCFLHREWIKKHEWWLKLLPEFLYIGRISTWLVSHALKLVPRTEGAPVIYLMEDRAHFKVSCIDVVPGHILPLVRAAMRKHFPTVELRLIPDCDWRGEATTEGIPELRAMLLEANLDTYYTTEELSYSRLKYTPGLKVLFFTSWSDI